MAYYFIQSTLKSAHIYNSLKKLKMNVSAIITVVYRYSVIAVK